VPAPRWGNGDLAGLKLVGSQAAPFVPAPLPILTTGPVTSRSKTTLTVSATVTTEKSAIVCIASGKSTADPATWSELPVSVTGPVKDKVLPVTLTGLTANTNYGYRARLMPTTGCTGPVQILPFTEIKTAKTLL
jgi:hypothetical protein